MKPDLAKQKRAAGYAMALVYFQEVGLGPDKHLPAVRQVVSLIRGLCEEETGIELSGYPTDFVRDNEELIEAVEPFCLNEVPE